VFLSECSLFGLELHIPSIMIKLIILQKFVIIILKVIVDTDIPLFLFRHACVTCKPICTKQLIQDISEGKISYTLTSVS